MISRTEEVPLSSCQQDSFSRCADSFYNFATPFEKAEHGLHRDVAVGDCALISQSSEVIDLLGNGLFDNVIQACLMEMIMQ